MSLVISNSLLTNQDQNICVRRERGNCRICWSAAIATDFDLNGNHADHNLSLKRGFIHYVYVLTIIKVYDKIMK